MSRAYSFLINPLSGGGAAPEAVIPVARILRDAGASVEVTYSPGPKACVDIVAGAVGSGDVVVSVGGDGMLSSIAGQVASLGGTLGIVPAGRGNDFARMLDLPGTPQEQARLLLDANPTQVDLLALTLSSAPRRVVAGSVYSGVDAIADQLLDRVRWMPRGLQYPYAAIRSLATYTPVQARVLVDGMIHEVTAAAVVVANSGYYGSGMRIAPAASVTDGLLDVVVIGAASRWDLIRSMSKVYDGTHVDHDEVTVLQGRVVEISGAPTVPMGGDGEPLGRLPASPDVAVGRTQPARIEVLPQTLSLLTP